MIYESKQNFEVPINHFDPKKKVTTLHKRPRIVSGIDNSFVGVC